MVTAIDDRGRSTADRWGDALVARDVRVSQPVDPAWIVSAELVERVIREHHLHLFIPADHVRRLMSSRASRPASIGPGKEGIYTVSAVRAWLADHGLEPVR